MSRVVLMLNGKAHLLLVDVERNADGTLQSGRVANGGWRFERDHDDVIAKNGSTVLRRFKNPGYVEREVPDDVRGHCDAVMAWAEAQL